VFTGEQSRRALVIAADLSLRELVKNEAASLVERFGSDDLAAELPEISEPVAEVERELLVEILAELLREGRRVSRGRDRDLEVSSPNDGGEVEVTEGRIVDSVAEHPGRCGLGEDGAIDSRVVGRSDDEEGTREVALLISSSVKRKLT